MNPELQAKLVTYLHATKVIVAPRVVIVEKVAELTKGK